VATALHETLELLAEARSRSDAVLAAYSDGKDSRVVLDLCLRTFSRVELFFMEFIPGLRCVEEGLEAAEQRIGKPIRRYPHWLLAKCIKGGVYCAPWFGLDDLPDWKLADVYQLAMADTGIPLLATGAKRADSLWRKRQMNTWGKADHMLYPLAGWNKIDVLGYLQARGIPIPDSSGAVATGIDLSTPSLLWLHDRHPEDFERVCRYFPYARAVVYRRKFFGLTSEADRRAKSPSNAAG
jgi:hypothetical protein